MADVLLIVSNFTYTYLNAAIPEFKSNNFNYDPF